MLETIPRLCLESHQGIIHLFRDEDANGASDDMRLHLESHKIPMGVTG
jgi:hypothetical protein